MKKFQWLAPALFTALVFCAVNATAAFAAETYQWLVESNTIPTGDLPAESEGDLTLIQLASTKDVLEEILCELIFDGGIGPTGEGTIDKVLNLAKEEISNPLGIKMLECTVMVDHGEMTDCQENTTALVWFDNLPWKTSLELMLESPAWLIMLGPGTGGEPGWDFECTLLNGLKLEELCEGLTSAAQTNEVGTSPASVLGEFNWEAPVSSESGTCSILGAGAGVVKGILNTWAIGGTLALPEALNRLPTSVSDI